MSSKVIMLDSEKYKESKYNKYTRKQLLKKVYKLLIKEADFSFETFKICDKEELIRELERW